MLHLPCVECCVDTVCVDEDQEGVAQIVHEGRDHVFCHGVGSPSVYLLFLLVNE